MRTLLVPGDKYNRNEFCIFFNSFIFLVKGQLERILNGYLNTNLSPLVQEVTNITEMHSVFSSILSYLRSKGNLKGFLEVHNATAFSLSDSNRYLNNNLSPLVPEVTNITEMNFVFSSSSYLWSKGNLKGFLEVHNATAFSLSDSNRYLNNYLSPLVPEVTNIKEMNSAFSSILSYWRSKGNLKGL